MEETIKYITDNLIPIIKNTNEKLEGNLFTQRNSTKITNKFIDKIKNIEYLSKNSNNILEIGFNSGFSSLLMLFSNPNCKITCLDICFHKYTKLCYNKIKEDFKDRINLIEGNSNITIKSLKETYDLIHIDGGHTIKVAKEDIKNSILLSDKKTIIIMDDCDNKNLNKLFNSFDQLKDLEDNNLIDIPQH